MTLEVTPSLIKINNASGVEKFNSSQRLLYQTGYATGSGISLNSNIQRTRVQHGLTIDETRDIVAAYVTLTSAGGAIGSSLVGLRQPAQGMIPIDFYARNVSNKPAIDSSWITLYVSPRDVFFYGGWMSYADNMWGTLHPEPINYSITLNWEIFVYNYTS